MLGLDDTSEFIEREREKKISFRSKIACALFMFRGGSTVLRNA